MRKSLSIAVFVSIMLFISGFHLIENLNGIRESYQEPGRTTGTHSHSDGRIFVRKDVEELLPQPARVSAISVQEVQFTGFVQNSGQLGILNIDYYYSTSGSFVGFGESKIHFRQALPQSTFAAHDINFELSFTGSRPVGPTWIYQLN